MDTLLLRAFVLLAETQNYREASQRLFITQPALSKKIKLLENELGLTLFVRGRHGAQLTHAGELLLEKARELVEQGEALRHYALDIAKGTKGNLAIGFGISGIKIAPDWVARFRRAYPDVIVSLEDISSTQQTAQLLSGQLQLAFMRMPVEPSLIGLKLISESLVLAVKKKTVPATTDLQDYQLIASQPFIQLSAEKGPGLFRQIELFLEFNHIVPNIVQRTRDLQTMLALVVAGVGVAVVPESTVYIAPEGIDMIPLRGPYAHWDVGMFWNPALADPLRDLFIAMVQSANEGDPAA